MKRATSAGRVSVSGWRTQRRTSSAPTAVWSGVARAMPAGEGEGDSSCEPRAATATH